MAGNDIGRSSLEALGPHESVPVKSGLKPMLDRELAEEASTPRANTGGAASPQHLASPGRIAYDQPHAGHTGGGLRTGDRV